MLSRRAVSVLMPIYNSCSTVADSIDSILDQTYPTLHLVLIDDGSTDGSADIIDGYEALYAEKHRLAVIRLSGL